MLTLRKKKKVTSIFLCLLCLILFYRINLKVSNCRQGEVWREELHRTELIKLQNFESSTRTKMLSFHNKTKFMFTKNEKVASSTMTAILLQIATHYHKYEIFMEDKLKNYFTQNQTNLGYSIFHYNLNSLQTFHKLFPKREFIWISTTRKVEDQINSIIKFHEVQKLYKPKKFGKMVKRFEKKGKYSSDGDIAPFHNGGTSFILYSCKRIEDFDLFKLCAEKIFSEFDLIIPVDRLNEGLVMIHKLTGLPLSDFAYINKYVSSDNFTLSPQNMSTILKYHEQSIWFYNHSSKIFDKIFREFQLIYCQSKNCRDEILDLKRENKKLEISCGIKRFTDFKFSSFSFDWNKLRANSSLALRCLSFGISGGDFGKYSQIYNRVIKRHPSDGTVDRIAKQWTRLTKRIEK